MIRARPIILPLMALSGCDGSPEPRVGALYSVNLSGKPGEAAPPDGKAFQVVKVLSIEPPMIYARLYRNRWTERPSSVDPGSLTVGRVGDPAGFGAKVLPFAEATFPQLAPRFVREVGVSPDERADLVEARLKLAEDADHEKRQQEWLRGLPNRPPATRPSSEYDGLDATELRERLKQAPSPSPN